MYLAKMAKMEKMDDTRIGKGVKQSYLLNTAGEDVNCYNYSWKLLGNMY